MGSKFVVELIQAFLDHLAATLEIVSPASARGDLATVAKQVHSIKGSSRQLEVEVIGALCEQIETLAKENKLREVQLLTLRLEEESRVVRRGFELYLEVLSGPQPAPVNLDPDTPASGTEVN